MRLTPLVVALTLLPAFLVTHGGKTPDVVTAERLGGEQRYLTNVTTDKPIYRGGETLFARGVVLHAVTRRPLAEVGWTSCEVLGPKGDVVFQSGGAGADGIVPFAWAIPDGQAGGLYKLRMKGAGVVAGERAFEIRAFRAPRIKSQIVFMRDGYGPGDEVTAALQATRAEGGAPEGAALTLVAMLDGAEVARRPAGRLDSSGRASVSFTLPREIERGVGTLALVIEDGGVVETATKTLPILLRHVDLAVYPEGGDLVAGMPTRLYLEARTPADKPADIAGTIESRDGTVVARFRTEHEGRGRVQLTPVAGETYLLRVTEPAGVVTTVRLPAVETDGGTVGASDDVVQAGAPLLLRVGATERGVYELTVASREHQLAAQKLDLQAGQFRRLSVTLPDNASGVLRVTLWDEEHRPLAERLVFRRPATTVNVEMSCDRERYVPGGKVALHVRTTDEDGRPVPAMVGLSVSDDTVRELLETRDQPPQLPVQVFLESDVRELADAAVYLNDEDEKAPLATDLLLGTQGWRRFAWIGNPDGFVKAHGDAGRRALAWPEPSVQAVSVDMLEDDAGGLANQIAFAARGDQEWHAMAAVPPAAPPPVAELAAAAPQRNVAAKDDQPALEPAPVQAKVEAVALDRGDFRQAVAGGFVEGFERERLEEKKLKRQAMQVVRVYAHAARPGRVPGERTDFTDTVYWNAGVKTDESGEATVSFELSDAVTAFRVLGDAFTSDGSLGAATRTIESVRPFYLEPKLPLEVTSGDVVRLPVVAVNGTTDRLDGVEIRVSATGPLTVKQPTMGTSLQADARVRSLVGLTVGAVPGEASVTIDGAAAPYRDSVTRTLRVAPLGFPSSLSFGGTISAGARASHDVEVPRDLVASSVRTSAQVFPTSLGKLTGALERLITEPYGCFEQTSSTTYPLVMAQQYFTTHAGVDPALVTRSNEMLGKGYEKLTSFECKTRGYEWFGESPGHEALSAFGLLELTDMGRVRQVDQAMLARTREWVLGTRDGKGGFKRERRALHTWIEDVDCSNAYIVWALLETGEPVKNLATEIDAVGRAATASKNAYVHALAANVMQLAGRKSEAEALLSRLASVQDASGKVQGATASIVGSTGDALEIETTALATLAWLRSPAHAAQVSKAVRWLAESCEGGRYGSTQSTVLALRAIVAHDGVMTRPRAAGRLTLLVDGTAVGEAVAFDASTEGALVLPDFASALRPGKHRVEVVMDDGSDMPYAIEISMNRTTPDSSPDCPLEVEVSLTDDHLVEGEIGEVTLALESRSAEALPMAVAIVGLPGGLEPRHEQLKELVRAKTVAAYEVNGREIVLYFRSLEPHAAKRIPLSVVAAVPGTYTGPASRAYLYYGDEHKAWAPGLTAEIAAR